MWQLKYAITCLLIINLVFITYLLLYTKTIVKDHTGMFGNKNLFIPWNEPNHELVEGKASCQKKLLLFGMKQHWKEFCKFPQMPQFNQLVQFPRTFDCSNLSCSVNLTYSESIKDIRGADMVLFTDVYQWLTPDMWAWAHGNRSETQPWVLISLDSPLYASGLTPPEKFYDTSFNWIASYKSDSDVSLPFGYYEPFLQDKPLDMDLKSFVQNKTRLIAWMSSNCETLQWDRLRLVNELNEIIHVDMYGKCGEKEVPWNDRKVINSLLGNHKFYLSFENSCCDDYISEKFWRALDIGMVPIVVGASLEQYTKFAPPGSFIHVEQFPSLAALSVHITIVANNEEKYLEYCRWREKGRIVVISQEDQYVTPLQPQTQCSILERYLQYNSTREKRLNYMGKRWGGSCRGCGEHWIKKYMISS